MSHTSGNAGLTTQIFEFLRSARVSVRQDKNTGISYRLCLLLLGLLLAASFVTSNAGIKDRPYSLHLEFGGVQPALNDSAQVWLFSANYGGAIQYMLTPQFGLLLSTRHTAIHNDSVSTSIFKLDKERANRKWTITRLSLGPKIYLDQRKRSNPFLYSTIDLLVWKVSNVQQGTTMKVANSSGNIIDYSASEMGVSLGLGFERLFAERIGLAFSGELTFLTGVGADFAQSVNNARSRALLQFSAAISVHFGGKRTILRDKFQSDGESDSARSVRRVYEAVVDRNTGDTIFVDKSKSEDQTPFVPISQTPVIVEHDSDNDGVADDLDKCPDTPAGALVDNTGCPHDSDSDGVPDGIDKCPNTPWAMRLSTDKFGCPIDTDLDGVPDYLDQCPNTPPDTKVDSLGCPLDSDRDGVDDASDLCPGTPRGIPVDNRGCPDMEQIFYKRILTSLFRAGETKISRADSVALDSIVTLMELFPEVAATVSAYTDDVGPWDANQKVSQKRADAVLLYLVKHGISSQRVQAVGKGEVTFVASNRTKDGRERNRRIEIEFRY